MDNRQRTWTLLAAALSFIVGLILVMNDSAAGWFLIIVGLSYIGTSTRTGQEWAESNPSLSRWVLIGITLLLIVLVAVGGAVLLLK